MKKLGFLLLIITMSSATVLSQKPVPKSVFSADLGVAVAYDEFALNSFEYDAGFATAGPNAEAGFLYYGRFAGISLGMAYTNIFFNEKAYQAEYDRVLSGYGENTVNAGNYHVFKLQAGLVLKVPEFRHTEVMLLFQTGYALCVHPELTVMNTELGEINSIAGTPGESITGTAGLKVNYWLSDRFGVTLNSSLNAVRPGFGDDTGPAGAFFLPMRYYTVDAGLVIRINAPAQ